MVATVNSRIMAIAGGVVPPRPTIQAAINPSAMH